MTSSETVLPKIVLLSQITIGLAVMAGSIVASRALEPTTENWGQFRGPNCSGVSAQARPPVTIGPTNGVLWAFDVPWSPSSTSVWSERIFLTTAVGDDLQTRCFDAKTGKMLWSRGVTPPRIEAYHPTENSPASCNTGDRWQLCG